MKSPPSTTAWLLLIWADVPDPSVIRVDGADGRPVYI